MYTVNGVRILTVTKTYHVLCCGCVVT